MKRGLDLPAREHDDVAVCARGDDHLRRGEVARRKLAQRIE
jgi:hypothetical protein